MTDTIPETLRSSRPLDPTPEVISIPPTRSPRWRARIRALGVRPSVIRRCAAGRRQGLQILAERDERHAWAWTAPAHQ